MLSDRKPNQALRDFFLLSIVFHMIVLFFLGRMFQRQGTEYRMEVDLKIVPSSSYTMDIPRPKPARNHTDETPPLSSQLPLSAHHKAIQKPSPRTCDATSAKISSSQPYPLACPKTPVHSIKRGVHEIVISRVPLFLKPSSTQRHPTGTYQDFIKNIIKPHIQEHLRYPLSARRRGLEGTVHVEFLLYPDGRLGDIRITKSSNHPVLDHAAVDTIRAGSPYPPFPNDIKKYGEDVKKYRDGAWIPYEISFKLE